MSNLFEKYYDVVYDQSTGIGISCAIKEVIVWARSFTTLSEAIAKNDDLCDAVFDRLDTHLIIASLRSTFMIKDHLECWTLKVDEAELILGSRGLEARRLLQGLKRFPK